MAGTSSSQSFSYSGYHQRSVSGGSIQCPPEGSGLRLQPTKPSDLTQRSSSATHFAGGTPGDCGNWQTPTKLTGYSVQQRWIRSLQTCDQARLTAASPMWWPMPAARGEKMV